MRYTCIFPLIQYRQRHTMINYCDRLITHLSDTDISFVLLIIFSKFFLHLECYLLSPKRHIKINKQIKQTKRYISITKKSDMSITLIYHAMSLTVLYAQNFNVVASCELLTVHSKCINDHDLRSDIFLPKCQTNLRVNTL